MESILGINVTKTNYTNAVEYTLSNEDKTVNYTFSNEFLQDAIEIVGENAVREAFVGIMNKKILPPLRIRNNNGKYCLVCDYVIAST